MADETKTAAPTVKKGLKEYASDPAAALNEVAAALKDGVSGTPLEDPIRQAAVAAGLDDGLVVLIGCLLFSLITISIFGATNIITWFGFIAPALSSIKMMQGSDAEKKVMDNKMPVYWIVFSGLLCLESIGLIVGMIPLYWLVKGLALFWMWEMDGTKTVFNLLSKAAVKKAA